jgi:hypothetical protein
MAEKVPLAGVSGPGKFSVREDLPPSQNYGDRKQMQEDIAGAPTSAQPSAKPQPLTGLFAPTERPDVPITTGLPIGEGPGPEALMMNQGAAAEKLSDTLAKMIPYDETGEIAVLYQQALARGQ